MNLTIWKRRKFTPAWGGNREDEQPCSVSFLPPTVGWMARWRELVLRAPAIARETSAALEAGEELPANSWEGDLEAFRQEVLAQLIVSVDDLFDGDRAMPLPDAVSFICENPGLRDEVFQAIVDSGQVTQPEGKD